MPVSHHPLRTALLLLVPVFVVLFGVIPYTYSHLQGHDARLVSVAHALWVMWNSFPDFQHGMIVPLLAGFVVFRQRQVLSSLPITGWWPGIILVALTLTLYWAGRRVDNQYIGFFSIQLLLASLILWIFGWQWLRSLAFPLLFLTFAWPMPFLDNIVTFPLRMLMSNFAASSLNSLGLNVTLNGTGILSAENPALNLPSGALFRVDVADPCSGIRSLFALMMVSALYGYFALKTPVSRFVLFLTSIPLAIAGNLVRIMLLTFGVVIMGAPTAIGTLEEPSFFHQLAGYAVFAVALSGMIFIGNLLREGKNYLWFLRSRGLTKTPTFSAPSREPQTSGDIY